MTATLFDDISAAAAEVLRAALQPVEVRRGQPVFRQGEPGDSLFVVCSGTVKLSRSGREGRENLLSVSGPGDVFGELSVFDPGPRTASATALTDAHLEQLDATPFRSWLSAHPEMSGTLLRQLTRRLRRADTALSELVVTDVPGRLAKALLTLAERFGAAEPDGLRVHHGLTQSELAQLVGASRERVNKALADFAAQGWLTVTRRTVLILDTDQLARRARQGAGVARPASS